MFNFHPDTRGVKVVTYLGSLVQSCSGEGGTPQTNISGVCGECSQCLGHTGFAPIHAVCAFPFYTAQAPGCPAGEPSKRGPGLHALSRSKRLRSSGTPHRHRLGWACVLCPSQGSSGDQVLGEHALPTEWWSYHLPGPRPLVSWARHLGCAVCLLWGADLCLQPSW